MPVEIKCYGQILHKRFSGHLSTDMLLDAIGSNLSLPEFEDLRYGLFDFTDVTSHDLTSASIHDAAAFDKYPSQLNPRLLVALVVTDPVLSALAEQYAADQTHNFTTKVFSALDDAKSWLGVSIS